MSNIPENIWQVPAYLPYVQPKLTKRAIERAEKKIGYHLPNAYIELLRVQNGGYIRLALDDFFHDTIAGIGPHYPTILNHDWEDDQEYVSFPLEGLIPFDGDGHWHLCLDYRENREEPSVTYIYIESDREEKIATTFSEYLKKLKLETDNGFVIETEKDLVDVLQCLESALRLKFEGPATDSHGYAEYRAAVKPKKDSNWIWLSPNKVPRGFARKDDERYEEVKDWLPGDGLRFPELSELSCLLNISSDVESKVLQTIKECGLEVLTLGQAIKKSKS